MRAGGGITRSVDLSTPTWCANSYSDGGGQCLEAADGLSLAFEPATWSSFVAGVKGGQLSA
ncbi:DUF397 domain-containing protein [Streptomyces wedmorensis]|uniref:DUF397 domain-containing protein n=1 Tax=Streptomyces wedmorensis TaxID=43759 RepID=A0ABW6IQH7_STRWE